ncbi:MAG: hypothetical protein JW963_15820 [Anaerolineales bacterium]|nr:hypothetical protein [Anaerolineales bacterium]
MNRSFPIQLLPFLRGTASRRGALFGGILLGALLAFEVFNYSTTDFALRDVLGDLRFAGLRWATILSLAFCGIDFAGIARLFTPEKGRDEPAEVWYLFGAWLLAAAMNAMLTWWGVSVAIINHTSAGGVLVGQTTMTRVVPVFVAVMVWLIRVLIIGTFSVAGENLFSLADDHPRSQRRQQPMADPIRASTPTFVRPAPKPLSAAPTNRPSRVEPTYHPIGMNAQSYDEGPGMRRQ